MITQKTLLGLVLLGTLGTMTGAHAEKTAVALTPNNVCQSSLASTETGNAAYYADVSSSMGIGHPTLPMGTWVKITHQVSKRSILLPVTSRGGNQNRIAMLSYVAAQNLNIIKEGIAPITLEVLCPQPKNKWANNNTTAANPAVSKPVVKPASSNSVDTDTAAQTDNSDTFDNNLDTPSWQSEASIEVVAISAPPVKPAQTTNNTLPPCARDPQTQTGLVVYYRGAKDKETAYTAAHLTLPFGTWVKLTHQKTGESVIVKINDRGPFGDPNRIIDISRTAAADLGILSEGTAPVRLDVVCPPAGYRVP